MTTPMTPGARFVRGWCAALIATLTASASHSLAGHTPFFGAGSMAALAASAVICVGLAGREMSARRISAAVLSSQLLFHSLFALFDDVRMPSHGALASSGASGTGAGALSPAAAASAGLARYSSHGPHSHHSHHAAVQGSAGSDLSAHGLSDQPLQGQSGSGESSFALADALFGGSWLMAASHLLAALVTILCLLRGERALAMLRKIAALVLPALPMLVRPPLEAPAPGRAVFSSPQPLTRLPLVLAGLRHRGPPAPQSSSPKSVRSPGRAHAPTTATAL